MPGDAIGPTYPLRDGDALLVVPPFYDVTKPSLAVHLLQACARDAGFHVSVLYANVLLAAELGVDSYAQIGFPKEYPPFALAGERFFAREAYDLPALGLHSAHMLDLSLAYGPSWAPYMRISRLGKPETLRHPPAELHEMAERVPGWLDRLADLIICRRFGIVGCSSTFNETNASVALFKRLKARDPHVITLLGGANCEGGLARAIVSLDSGRRVLDYVFSGDSEETFVRFLGHVRSQNLPETRIIDGGLRTDLDALPTPNYGEFFEQRDYALPGLARDGRPVELLYETSRGCRWGERRQCTFCGTNGEGIRYRQKSASRAMDDLRALASEYPQARVYMTDSVMPARYFTTLLPQLAEAELPLSIGYGERADLSLAQMIALKRAGVDLIQPGIEALSSSLLERMHKGTVARQNIALLRYASAVGTRLLWALLWGFPGDQREDYEETLALLPLLRHLPPPGSFLHVSIDRLSPYFERPDHFGVRNITPLGSYRDVFPPDADVPGLAHHFVADYESASHRRLDLIEQVAEEVRAWQAAWETDANPTILHVVKAGEGKYVLFDTRRLPGTKPMAVLDEREAAAALVARVGKDAPEIAWALGRKVGVVLDGGYVPLATAEPDLLQAFEAAARSERVCCETISTGQGQPRNRDTDVAEVR